MKLDGNFLWMSPLMEIVSAEERISKSTEKPYLVVKARMVFSGNPVRTGGNKRPGKSYTMMCFSEPLFALFEAGNQHSFEGELSFDWGNTWLKITKLYDDSGNRLLRPTKTEKANKVDEEIADSIEGDFGEYFKRRIKEIQEEKTGLSCTTACRECDHQDCDFFLPY